MRALLQLSELYPTFVKAASHHCSWLALHQQINTAPREASTITRATLNISSMSTTVTWVTPPAEAPPRQPDINYAPDPDKWQARAARRVAAGGLPSRVPEGFPEQLAGDLVWEGDTLADTYDWTYVLSPSQLVEIDAALAHFKCRSWPTPLSS